MTVRIEPEPTPEERQAIVAALASREARNQTPTFAVEEACVVAVEIIQPGLPTSPSAPSASSRSRSKSPGD